MRRGVLMLVVLAVAACVLPSSAWAETVYIKCPDTMPVRYYVEAANLPAGWENEGTVLQNAPVSDVSVDSNSNRHPIYLMRCNYIYEMQLFKEIAIRNPQTGLTCPDDVLVTGTTLESDVPEGWRPSNWTRMARPLVRTEQAADGTTCFYSGYVHPELRATPPRTELSGVLWHFLPFPATCAVPLGQTKQVKCETIEATRDSGTLPPIEPAAPPPTIRPTKPPINIVK